MNISLSEILFVLIIFQMLFLSLFLFAQDKGKRVSNILLGLFFLSISLNLLDFFLFISGAYSAHPWLAGWGNCLPLLFGPLIYLYTRSVLDRKYSFSSKDRIHLYPFAVMFAITEFYFLTRPVRVQEVILTGFLQHHVPLFVSIVSTLIFIQFLVYVIVSLKLVHSYRKEAVHYVSNSEQSQVGWLYSMIIFFLLIIILVILNGLLARTSLAGYYLIGFNVIVLAMLIFIMTTLVKALQLPYFFSVSGEDGRLGKHQSHTTDAEKAEKEKLAQTVLDYMQTHRAYLEPDLTLDQLATHLSTKPRILSQSINEILGQNFYDFVNRYRIKEASRLLTNPKDSKLTVLEVLYEVGFNSKSSFNTLFKKYTGLTPSEFRKKQSEAGSVLH